jgi:hypothetical protein
MVPFECSDIPVADAKQNAAVDRYPVGLGAARRSGQHAQQAECGEPRIACGARSSAPAFEFALLFDHGFDKNVVAAATLCRSATPRE